ncbi:BlaR1 family beta-lactam sensor/signal transducer [Alkaliphilus peptidifermentans]|uniref:Bla regulator protein blaR1 n=1 Tax=Alkaliphilus peptidifermentans DSM 18978 TaxID=1120976 RepID=A0A1G5E907_9FIRM|nr:BlaR1 family beta-lactam sensor/signal transducer [Alkaliphilus peptidifermentans]SCY23493.1 bla regulator protein blaR1 [Alkaliphilus peptidifermentans DSM 18978]
MDFFYLRLLISSIVTSSLILLILLVKRILNKHISMRWQYNIWFLVLGMLTIPFIPMQWIDGIGLYKWGGSISINEIITPHIFDLHYKEYNSLNSAGWLDDFALSVSRYTPEYLNMFFIGIWFAGIVILIAITILCTGHIKNLKRSIRSLQNEEIEKLFVQCKDELGITKKIILGESSLVQTPITFGLLRTYIILPTNIVKHLSSNQIKYVFLHELNHYKNKDIFINYLMCIFQMLYWFNPLVWIAFKTMRTDREIACDISVLKMLDESCYIDYGRTIIYFIEKLSQPSYLYLTIDISASKQQAKKRIEKITAFTAESKQLRAKSILIFVFIGCIIFSQFPMISAISYKEGRFDFQKEHLLYEDLSPFFNGFDGSFVLYDLQDDQYWIYNKHISTVRVSPNSTYKIFSALMALELNVIQDGNSSKHWNGTKYPFEKWNQDQDLSSAMKYSTNWYFQDLDRSVGLSNLQSYFEQIQYGNYDLSGGIWNYWVESSLCISPVEQVQMLKDFYTYNMPFKEENIKVVKDVLKLSEKEGTILSGKTGTGIVNDKGVNGWFIGYVEKAGNTFIFATYIRADNEASGSVAAEITLSILESKNIY